MRTSAGRVTLGVSIGAHSGGFDFYLVGDHHREFIITGPAATETARMEGIADAGEVVVSSATAARLEPGVLGGPKAEGVLVVEAPEAETAQPKLAPAISDADLASLVPASRRAHLTGGGEQSEHRQATVAFLEFSGIDSLTGEGGGEAVAASLGPLISATQESAERRGVYFHETDIGADGGKIVLIGGVPVVRGNDAERVLLAAHDVVSGHPPTSPVRLRAGVNAGRVFVFSHDFDVVGRRIFAVTGDAVNLAARVMGKSVAGQVVATEGALVRARNPFETQPLPPFNVKGKSQPVIAAALGRPRQAAAHDAVRDLPFAGREAEMAQVLAAATAAAEGAGSVIEVTGAPGIGKSRLITEAMDHWSLGTLRVACEEYESATPYLPFRRVLRRVLGLAEDTPHQIAAGVLRDAVRDLVPEMEAFLPLLAGVVDVPVPPTREDDELEPRFRRQRLELFVVRLLRAYLSAPSALVFEDAHAMDEASASLLGRIATEIGEWPLLVVLTRRREGGSPLGEGPRPALLLDLEPLAPEAAARLARSGGGDGIGAATGLAPAQVAAIVTRADGNPLFLRELLRTALEAGGVDALPDSLEPLLVAQIDLLSPADRQVLRAAAVLGAHFDPPMVEELLESGARADEAAWARLGAFVAPTATGWRFAHGLMRDAAYEGLSFKRRRELHGRAAHAIEARASAEVAGVAEAAELLSLHWLHAEQFRRSVALLASGRRSSPGPVGECRCGHVLCPGTRGRQPARPSPLRGPGSSRGSGRRLRAHRWLRAGAPRLRTGAARLRWRGGPGAPPAQDRCAPRTPGPLPPSPHLLHQGSAAPDRYEHGGRHRALRARPRLGGHQAAPGQVCGFDPLRHRSDRGGGGGRASLRPRPRLVPPVRGFGVPGHTGGTIGAAVPRHLRGAG